MAIYNNGKLLTDSPIEVKWSRNYKEFWKKRMKFKTTNGVIDDMKSIIEIYTYQRTHQQTLKW